ncbi:hypothetical protein A2U01_0002375, partial [Trifolium medium]|nr:hypothetical protein [Trifolium medium]
DPDPKDWYNQNNRGGIHRIIDRVSTTNDHITVKSWGGNCIQSRSDTITLDWINSLGCFGTIQIRAPALALGILVGVPRLSCGYAFLGLGDVVLMCPFSLQLKQLTSLHSIKT